MTATMRFLSVAVAPLGALLAGQIGQALGLRIALAACGLGCAMLFAGLWWLSPVRAVRAAHLPMPPAHRAA